MTTQDLERIGGGGEWRDRRWEGGVCGSRQEAEVVVLGLLSRGLMLLVGAEV